MPNRFKQKNMREMYDVMVDLYADPTSELYWNGEQRRGAGHRCAFWDGFNSTPGSLIRSAHAHPGTLSWACYRAGQDCAKQATSTPA